MSVSGACLVFICLVHCAEAADFGAIGGFDIRLDTATRLSLGLRTDGQDAVLLQNPNADDGDRAFGRGIISERVDVTSVLDATRGDLGAEVSTDGWYDTVYHRADADRNTTTFNPVGIPSDTFPADTRRLMGATIELGTGFVHDRVDVAGVPVTLRVGRQSVVWGESLFFAQDGIAAGQEPVDAIKALSQPLVENREIYLPVDQVYLRADLGNHFSLQGYEQLGWRRNRDPGVAGYFSVADIADVGGQRVLLPGRPGLLRARDATPDGFGQFGAGLRYTSDVVDLGIYALRYASKDGFIQTEGPVYRLVFPSGIETLGVSASSYAGDNTLAGEISVRRHMPLVSNGLSGAADAEQGNGAACSAGPVCAAGAFPRGYATGEVLLGLASFERQLPTSRFWRGATLLAEVSTTELLHAQSGSEFRLAGTTRFSAAAQAVFSPRYFEVLPHLDLSVPLGVRLGLLGRSSVDPAQAEEAGSMTAGISATYRTVWQIAVSCTRFLGPPARQPLADRSFVTFSLGRTF